VSSAAITLYVVSELVIPKVCVSLSTKFGKFWMHPHIPDQRFDERILSIFNKGSKKDNEN
jgi:hypothetical protein